MQNDGKSETDSRPVERRGNRVDNPDGAIRASDAVERWGGAQPLIISRQIIAAILYGARSGSCFGEINICE